MSFESALNTSQSLLNTIETGNYDEKQARGAITELVETVAGARGFFVVLLSGDFQTKIHLEPTVIEALKSSPEIVAQLLTKNLAMCTAMEVLHGRNGDEENLAGSQQVQKRVLELISELKLAPIHEQLEELKNTLENGNGSYQDFLTRFAYDASQKEAILKALDFLQL
jgi:hypothetical protein